MRISDWSSDVCSSDLARLDTGHVEVRIDNFEVLSAADQVPLQVNSDEDAGEEIRLRYRYLDLRRERVHKNILLRRQVITSIRRRMVEHDRKSAGRERVCQYV